MIKNIRFGADFPNGHFSIAEAAFARLCLNISTPPPSILIERIYQVNTSHEFIFITILDVDLQCSLSLISDWYFSGNKVG